MNKLIHSFIHSFYTKHKFTSLIIQTNNFNKRELHRDYNHYCVILMNDENRYNIEKLKLVELLNSKNSIYILGVLQNRLIKKKVQN